MSTEPTTPCNDPACCEPKATEGKTLEELRDELETVESLRETIKALNAELLETQDRLVAHIEQSARTLDRFETEERNRKQSLKNFEESINDLIEEDEEQVTWESLTRPLELLGITVKRRWHATVNIKAVVYIEAMTRDKANEILDGFYSGEVSINNRDFEDYEVDEIEWSNLTQDDN
jgi:predicted RNase H-like nuclease (RuvC/YqgF family)